MGEVEGEEGGNAAGGAGEDGAMAEVSAMLAQMEQENKALVEAGKGVASDAARVNTDARSIFVGSVDHGASAEDLQVRTLLPARVSVWLCVSLLCLCARLCVCVCVCVDAPPPQELFKGCGTVDRVTVLVEKYTGKPKGCARARGTRWAAAQCNACVAGTRTWSLRRRRQSQRRWS